jgi:signal transduction histidine kinase/CheY-like chemotaxis protein
MRMDKNYKYHTDLLEIYNCAYNSYLMKINPAILLNTTLDKVIKLINGKCGVLFRYNQSDENIHIITHVSNGKKDIGFNIGHNIKDEWSLFSEYIKKKKILHHDSLIMQSILQQQILVRKDCQYKDILGSYDDQTDLHSDHYSRCKNGILLFVPFVFTDHTNGLMLICGDPTEAQQINLELSQHIFKPFGVMMGVLINNINNMPNSTLRDPHNQFNVLDQSMTYQIMYDTLNIITDPISITDRDMRIIYKNDNFINFIRHHYNTTDGQIEQHIIDIIPQTISLMSNESNGSFYKNKKLEVITKKTNTVFDICVNSVTSYGGVYHILRFVDREINNNKNHNNSKNLVAYLSHELRNPIQAISTGIYIIDRSIKNLEKESDKKSQSSQSLKSPKISGSDNQSECQSVEMKKTARRSYLSLGSAMELTPQRSSDCIGSDCIGSDHNGSDSDDPDNLLILESSDKSNNQIDSPYNQFCDQEDDQGVNDIKILNNVVKRVSSACKNMNIIIDDILDLSKIDNDELIINLDEHCVRDITDLIYEESMSEITKKGLTLEYDFDPNTPEFLYTDNTRVFQILSNLISNSIKYSTTGTIRFKVSYDETNNSVIFEVSDQGKGIRKEELSNLFKKFGRTSNSVTDVNSTGLGLCVCNKIANLLGGLIEVKSEYKKGSTFTFIHPIKLGYSGSNIMTDIGTNRDISGKILIVDDDPNIVALFKLLLRCINYDKGYDLNIETATNGDRTMELTKNKKYDIIFMDIDLDGEDGCTICENILTKCTLNKNCPIIAVTANIKSVQHDRDPKFNCFNDVILKPFNNKDILKTINKYLR